MSASTIPIGSFELLEPIGKGGMAVVWRGHHRNCQIPVAVKVMTSGHALNPQFGAAFRNEVRALAGLDHPNIVMVWDYGEISAEAEAASGGRLFAGSPYLVMELASRGTLNQVLQPLRWHDLRRLLLSILDALAFAHSRGVIHLDLKPANVLLAGEGDTRAGLKLTDFGLAYVAGGPARSSLLKTQPTAVDMADWAGVIPGTPLYMAPEQFEGAHRDYGPWTDLYALGCLAYKLATGATPFCQDGFVQLMYAHFKRTPPPMVPRRPVPPGFEEWVQQLLQKDPGKRFQRAADAAWALMALGEPGDAEYPDAHGHPLRTDMIDEEEPATEVVAVTGWIEAALTSLASLPPAPRGVSREVKRPPLPDSWERIEPAAPWAALMGAGLGLYGLRAFPVVGRKLERDAMWGALRAVHADGRARLIALRGPAGTGKSRLVEWMSERAHEVGGATTLKASHSPGDGPGDGLVRMVARHMHCTGLGRPEVLERVTRLLQEQGVTDGYEWHALTELIVPSSELEGAEREKQVGRTTAPVIRFRDPNERYVVLRRLLERLAAERPLILWLEDVQWGSDALAFAEHLLKAQALTPSPILILLTVQDEAMAERRLESGQLEELLAIEGAASLPIAPLIPLEHLALVQKLLPLEKRLAIQVAERTRGNALFAVQLVGDWVQRGVLEHGPSGFTLKAGAEAVLPDNLHQVWTARLSRLLCGHPQDSILALELAAILGREVNYVEWRVGCEVAELKPPPELLDLLLSSRLAQTTERAVTRTDLQPAGWSFVHGMLRESLERSAREGGRWAMHHRSCVTLLKKQYPNQPPSVQERLGRHYLAAEWYEAALEPLLKAAQAYLESGDYRLANTLLNHRDTALQACNLPQSDVRWGEGWIARAALHANMGRLDSALMIAKQAELEADKHSWTEVQAQAVKHIATVYERRGDPVEAERRYQEALTLFRHLGDRRGCGFCLLGLASCARERGDLARVPNLLRQAQTHYRQCGDISGQSECLLRLGRHEQAASHFGRATSLYQEALVLFERVDNQLGRAATLRAMGLSCLDQRELARAADLIGRAMAIYQRIGSQFDVANCLNELAEIERARGDFEAAVAGYRRSIALHEAMGAGQGKMFPRYNLGLLLMSTGRYAEARQVLEVCRVELELAGRLMLLGAVHATLLPCVTDARDWDAWDAHFEQVLLFARSNAAEADEVWAIQLAGELARAAGEAARARHAFTLARTLWRGLNRADKIADVEAAMAQLG